MKSKGFTIIEVVITLLIIGLVMAIVVKNYYGYITRTNTKICAKNRNTLIIVESVFVLSEDRASSSTQELLDKNYLKRPISCPTRQEYTWTESVSSNGTVVKTPVCPRHGS